MIYCLFEQSGTFKNEFIKLNLPAKDIDIYNSFNETDIICDLFTAINNAYNNIPSIFDTFTKDDFILAFFPCDCFSTQFRLKISCNQSHLINSGVLDKLVYSSYCHDQLNDYYKLFCRFFYVLYSRGLKAAVENPFHDSYLIHSFPIKPTLIDMDRRKNGDFYKKPTQYFFINFEPKNNVIFEPIPEFSTFRIDKSVLPGYDKKIMRSKISDVYANRFIRQFIIPY